MELKKGDLVYDTHYKLVGIFVNGHPELRSQVRASVCFLAFYNYPHVSFPYRRNLIKLNRDLTEEEIRRKTIIILNGFKI